MCLRIKWQAEPRGNQRWWDVVSQRWRWISREAKAEAPVSWRERRSCPGWMPLCCPCCCCHGTLRCSGWTLRCLQCWVQGGWARLVRTRLKSCVDSVPSPLGQRSTASLSALSFLPANHCLLRDNVFPVSSENEMRPMGWKESVVETKL